MSICLVYRSPNSSENNTEHLFNLFKSSPSTINMIIGDLNLPILTGNWGCNLILAWQENFYTQLVDFPTHIRGNTLDLASVNCPDPVISVESIRNVGYSDHTSILIEMYFEPMSCGGDDLIKDYKNTESFKGTVKEKWKVV